jgi:hypothetical protein
MGEIDLSEQTIGSGWSRPVDRIYHAGRRTASGWACRLRNRLRIRPGRERPGMVAARSRQRAFAVVALVRPFPPEQHDTRSFTQLYLKKY